MNSYSNAGTGGENPVIGFLLGTGVVSQIVLFIVLSVVLYIFMMILEVAYTSFRQIGGTRVDILPETVSAKDKMYTFVQDPSSSIAKTLPYSDNERTGIEFSYSFFLWINPSSFKMEDGLLHIMHKGHPKCYPLMSPGVFLHSNANTLRIYQNSSDTWNNYIDVDGIPVKKWVHVVIVARANSIEVYLNGNLTKKLKLEKGVLYQNYGDLYLFNPRIFVENGNTIKSIGANNMFKVDGTFDGKLSRLTYFSYALTYTEIQGLNVQGANPQTVTQAEDAPPYFTDNWWVNSYSQ